MSHRNLPRQHTLAEVACYRTERTLVGCTDPLRSGRSVHTTSALELTKNEADWASFATSNTLSAGVICGHRGHSLVSVASSTPGHGAFATGGCHRNFPDGDSPKGIALNNLYLHGARGGGEDEQKSASASKVGCLHACLFAWEDFELDCCCCVGSLNMAFNQTIGRLV